MKTLFLLRHAKAENAAPGSPDFDRELNEPGRKQAQAVGRFIKERNVKCDVVLSSSAARARETTDLVFAAAELTCEVRYDERIYEAAPLRLLAMIAEIEQNMNTTLLVGHNPGIAELLTLLTGRAEAMGTATLARIDLNAPEWGRVAECPANLEWIANPKENSQSPT